MSFFFNDTAPSEIYTLSLHDALPISEIGPGARLDGAVVFDGACVEAGAVIERSIIGFGARIGPRALIRDRSEEHTSELQSHSDLVCRLLLEKKNNVSHAIRRSSVAKS